MKRPILHIFIPFAIGIYLSELISVPDFYIFVISLLLLLSAYIFLKFKTYSQPAIFLAILLFGVFYYQNSTLLSADHVSRFLSDKPVKAVLRGIVSDDPAVSVTPYNKVKTAFVISAEALKEAGAWHEVSGLVDGAIYSSREVPVKFGQRITLNGYLSKPTGLKNPGLFDYPKYLAIKNIYATFRVRDGADVEIQSGNVMDPVRSLAYRARNRIRRAIDRYFESPYGGFIKAIMIGDRTDLKYNLNSDFIKTGTVHAIAISGLNVGLIAAMLMSMLALLRLPKKLNLAIAACAMVVYAFIAGASPPIVRAVIIFAVFVIGYLMNRESDMLNSLAFTAVVMLLANPKELFDPSFQLSFASIAGMILFVPGLNSLLRVSSGARRSIKDKLAHYALSGISVSIAAWLATWPIVATYFNIVSPVSLLANLVVVPALFLLTAGSFIFLAVEIFSGALAAITAHWLSLFSAALFRANHTLAGIPFAYFRTASPGPEFILIYYSMVALLLAPQEIKVSRIIIKRSWVLIILLLALNILIWGEALDLNKNELKITFMDVGQGDAALIELPGGRNVLVDAGPGGDDERFDAARAVVAPTLWNRGIRKLDAVIATHFHEDHIGGMTYILDNFKVGCVMDNGAICADSAIYDKYIRAVRSNKIRRDLISDGDRITFSGGVISVLNPESGGVHIDSNENSVVLKLEYNNFSALICGDVSGEAIGRMVDANGEYLRSYLIKVPHHGGNIADPGLMKKFFDACDAKIAVISVAKANKYHTPSPRTLDILNASDPKVYQTKDSGAIIVTVFGDNLSVKTYLENN